MSNWVIQLADVTEVTASLSGSEPNRRTVLLSWNDTNSGELQESSFDVQRSISGSNVWESIASLTSSDEPIVTYEDRGLAAGTDYLYRVASSKNLWVSTAEITSSVAPTVATLTDYIYRIAPFTQTTVSGNLVLSNEVLTDALDSSVNQLAFNLNVVSLDEGNFGQGMIIPYTSSLDFTDTTNMSFTIWIREPSFSANSEGTILALEQNRFIIYRESSTFNLYSMGRYYDLPGFVTENEWYHLAFVYDGTQSASNRAKLYLNGALQTPATVNYDPPTTFPGPSTGHQYWSVGCYVQASASPPFIQSFTGSLDECSFWNQSLSAEQVSDIYNSGSYIDINSLGFVSGCVEWFRFGDNPLDYLAFPVTYGSISGITGSYVSSSLNDFRDHDPTPP